MSENHDEAPSVTMFGAFKVLIPHLPTLMIRLAGTFLRFKLTAKRGAATFQQELIAQGLSEDVAQKLTDMYLETSNFKTYLNLFR